MLYLIIPLIALYFFFSINIHRCSLYANMKIIHRNIFFVKHQLCTRLITHNCGTLWYLDKNIYKLTRASTFFHAKQSFAFWSSVWRMARDKKSVRKVRERVRRFYIVSSAGANSAERRRVTVGTHVGIPSPFAGKRFSVCVW